MIILTCALIASCGGNKQRLPYLGETFGLNDKFPFGVNVAHELIKNMYQDVYNQTIDYVMTTSDLDSNSMYISITGNFDISDSESQSLISIIEDGNSAFISSNNFHTHFLDELGVKTNNVISFSGSLFNMQDVGVWLNDSTTQKEVYSFFYSPFTNHFISFDTNATVLGYNDSGQPNFLKIKLDEGYIFLHSEPRALSNYFLLTDNNYEYLNQLMNLVYRGEDAFYWDGFHGNANNSNTTSASYFSELMNHPSLKFATLLFLGLLFVYVYSESKRKRSIIPILKPNTNSNVSFTETIARLYYQKKDNKNIAMKMIVHINEYLRSKYFHQGQDMSASWLSKKSGLEESDIEALYSEIEDVKKNKVVDDSQLARLNDLIFKFYK